MKGHTSTFNFVLVFFVALGSFLYGFNSSIIGTVFGLPSFYVYFDLHLTGPGASYANHILGCKYRLPCLYASESSLLTCYLALNGLWSGGGIIGCIALPYLANSIGRKLTIQIICLICIVAVILQCAAVHIAMLLMGRFLGGLR